MKSRFRQPSNPTTLDYQLGWHWHARTQSRVAYERQLRAMGASDHQVVLALKGCTPENPCGMVGCVNTGKRTAKTEKSAAN